PTYLAEHGEPQLPHDLAGHGLVVASDVMDAMSVSLSCGRHVEHIAVKPVIQTGEMASVFQVVLADGGIGPVPDIVATTAVKDGRLRAVLPHRAVRHARLHAITIAGHNAPARVRVF